MNIRIFIVSLALSSPLGAMEMMVKPAERGTAAAKEMQAFCQKVERHFEQGVLSQSDVVEFNELVNRYQEHKDLLCRSLGQWFERPHFKAFVREWLQVLLDATEFEPSEKEQIKAIRSFIHIVKAAITADKGQSLVLQRFMESLDMLVTCNALSAETAGACPLLVMMSYLRKAGFCPSGVQEEQRSDLTRLQLLEARRDAIHKFLQLRSLAAIHDFVKANAQFFDSVKDLVNARGVLMDNTLLHILIEDEMLHHGEVRAEIAYIFAYLIALGALIDMENIGGKTVRDLLYADRFKDIAAFVSNLNPVQAKKMDLFAVHTELRDQEKERIKSSMREATEPNEQHTMFDLLARYRSPLQREIEALKAH